MLLTLDAGNTNVDLGLFAVGDLVARGKIATASLASPGDPAEPVLSWLATHARPGEVEVAVGSVVGGLGPRLVAALGAQGCQAAAEIHGAWDFGLRITYEDPRRVGVDRIAAAAAAFAANPAGYAVVVADAGTAITVDAVDADGTFRGGIIAPGLRLGLEALRGGTSLLPRVELNPEATLFGTSTRACLEAGALHGGAALLDGLCERMTAALASPVQAWLTGGDADLLHAVTRRFGRCDPALVLRGLALAWQRRASGCRPTEH